MHEVIADIEGATGIPELIVLNKSIWKPRRDRDPAFTDPKLSISTATGKGLDELRETIFAMLLAPPNPSTSSSRTNTAIYPLIPRNRRDRVQEYLSDPPSWARRRRTSARTRRRGRRDKEVDHDEASDEQKPQPSAGRDRAGEQSSENTEPDSLDGHPSEDQQESQSDDSPSPDLELLEKVVKSFNGDVREGQRKMVEAVADTLENTKHLLVEAGTGTGKSLGYPFCVRRAATNGKRTWFPRQRRLQRQTVT